MHSQNSNPSPHIYPYNAIGKVLKGRLFHHLDHPIKCFGQRCDSDGNLDGSALLEAKEQYKDRWRRIIGDALNKTTGSSSNDPIFSVSYAGETALAMMTPTSPLYYYINFASADHPAPVAVIQTAKRLSNFDVTSARDAKIVADTIKTHFESLISASRESGSPTSFDRSAITIVPDSREGIVGFVIRNVPLVPPVSPHDDDEKESEKKTRTKKMMLTDIRILLPVTDSLGPSVHADTNILMEVIGQHPFLSETLRGALLWAKAQRFYLDDEQFIKLHGTTRTETVLRGSTVEDLFHRAFGTMSLCSLVISATEVDSLVRVVVDGEEDDPSKCATLHDDPSQDEQDATVGRYFMAFVRFLSSKTYFSLQTTPDATTKGSRFTINVPTIDGTALPYRLNGILGRDGNARSTGGGLGIPTASGNKESRTVIDCRPQYHYTRDIAALTEKYLGTTLDDLEEDFKIRYLSVPRQGASNREISANTNAAALAALDEDGTGGDPLLRWVDAVLFGIVDEVRNDNNYNDPIRAVRSAIRCEGCGIAGVAKSLNKKSTYCGDCAIAVMRERVAEDSSNAKKQQKIDAAFPTLPPQTSPVPMRGRGRGRGRAENGSISSTSTAPDLAARGRGRGRGASVAPVIEESRSVIDGINYEGICVGCDRPTKYLEGKPLAEMCFKCIQ